MLSQSRGGEACKKRERRRTALDRKISSPCRKEKAIDGDRYPPTSKRRVRFKGSHLVGWKKITDEEENGDHRSEAFGKKAYACAERRAVLGDGLRAGTKGRYKRKSGESLR